MLAPELKGKINKLWDKFWAGGLANPLTAIEQISYLIFLKRLEDIDNHEKKRVEAKGEKYKSIFEGTTAPFFIFLWKDSLCFKALWIDLLKLSR